MYTVADFSWMIDDRVRMSAYEAALRRAVRPGSVVVDVGAGTGIFTLWACKLGAARVYAIEPTPAISVLRENVVRNGFGDRVVAFRALSTDVELPEKADVLVSDLRGAIPLFSKHISAVADARTRYLRAGGIQIPQRDELRVALLESTAAWDEVLRGSAHPEFDLSAARHSILHTEQSAPEEMDPRAFLSEGETWATLDYCTRSADDASASGTVRLIARRRGTCHGLVMWFRATLLEGIAFENGPDAPRQVYRRQFLPWPEPVELAEGDSVDVSLRAVLFGDEYVWSWHSVVGRSRSRTFHQTSFDAHGLVPFDQRRRTSLRVSERGRATAAALTQLSNGDSVTDVARALRGSWPSLFPSEASVGPFLHLLIERYGA